MKYVGSKNKISKQILPIILKDRKVGQCYVEPFSGGANMIDKVEDPRLGSDCNEYLIELFNDLQDGWVPPDYVSEELWSDVKLEMDNKYEKSFIAFVRFGCSFGADWNGGFARNVRKDKPNAELLNSTTKSYCRQSKNNLMKQLLNIMTVDFVHCGYTELSIPPNSIIYCDPPYEGTLGYKDEFNHSDFWQWCRDKCKQGHKVFVSEYNAPDDFECLWQQEVKVSLNNTTKQSVKVEKLYTPLTSVSF